MADNSSGTDGYTRIMGRAEATVEQMRTYLQVKNPEAAQSVFDMVPLYLVEGQAEGVGAILPLRSPVLRPGTLGFPA